MKALLAQVSELKIGTIISVELPDMGDVEIYIVKLRNAQGRILTYRLDAASGALIDTGEF
ncbi:MAG: PepSY domain-containing protein [Allorhizobium sp.]